MAADAKVKAAGVKGPFGVGNAELNHFVNIAPKIYDKTATAEEQRIFAASVVNYTQPKTESYADPVTGKQMTRVITPKLPEFVNQAISNWPEFQKGLFSQPMLGAIAGGGTKPTASGAAQGPRPSGAVPQMLQQQPQETADTGLPQVPPKTGATPTLYELAPLVTGPVAGVATVGSKIPGIGGKIMPERQEARTYFNSTIQSLIPMLTSNPRFPVAEQKAIKEMLDIQPGVFDSGEALQNRIAGVDQFLADKVKKEETIANDPNTSVEMRRDALSVVADIQAFRQKFVPKKIRMMHSAIPVYSLEQLDTLADGTPFLWNGDKTKLRIKDRTSNAGAR